MKRKYLKVIIPTDWWIEDISIDDLGWEQDEIDVFKKNYPNLFEDDNFVLNIQLSDGLVTNWVKGGCGCFRTVKLVDTGSYYIIDEDGDMVEDYEGSYVPEVLSIVEKGFGDYLEFYIDRDGHIRDWKYDVTKKLYDQPQEHR